MTFKCIKHIFTLRYEIFNEIHYLTLYKGSTICNRNYKFISTEIQFMRAIEWETGFNGLCANFSRYVGITYLLAENAIVEFHQDLM